MPETLKPQWFQILLALSRAPMHGTAIMEEVLERTDGSMKLWPATLYGSLRDLEDAGWIAETEPGPDDPTEGGRRRFYTLVPLGQESLRAELDRMRAILAVAEGRNLLTDPEPTRG
jgi:DNA-binding PadR family transcriptional regulator